MADEAVLQEGRSRTVAEDTGDRHPAGRVGRPQAHSAKFEEWARSWLESTVHLKPKTRVGYESLLKSHVLPKFGGSRLDEIDRLDIQQWIAALHDDRKLSPSRIRQAYQVLSASLKAATQSRLLTHTPCVGIKLPRAVAREMQFLSADDVALLAKVIAEPYETLVYLLAYGGPPLGRNCRPQAEANRSGQAPDRSRRVRRRDRRHLLSRSTEELAAPHHCHPAVPRRSPR